jgi:hypothetical protein
VVGHGGTVIRLGAGPAVNRGSRAGAAGCS